MTESLKERITRVARIAQRTARNHEDQQEAQALIDEMAATQLDAPPAVAEVHAVPMTTAIGSDPSDPLSAEGKAAAGAPVEVATADTAPATKPVDKQKGAKR
jgi:hypothetical protein